MTTEKSKIIARYYDRLDELGQIFLRRLHQEIEGTLPNAITGNQFMMMKIISVRGRATVSSVADDLRVSLSAVTAQVDRLCKMGMVVRSRSEEDRRVVWLTLTNAGQDVVDICDAARQRVMQRYLGHLDEQDLLHMININEKILALMQQEEREGKTNKLE
ncbi:putative HTH-type transcriptional regulator YusO [Sporotomaculum syntrophicum]|uniref:HTH-type transcriptional regulator YusO n=1 Tax=Sporotomaculum syntrophicum TaxID=182264 RepID=A0A9D3AZL8_9FIRM|nr:MarR family transcriptional regulator [Sporotomaculum syntrophicum]KAF1086039.1 putative HTH-type transcriptional regulator YusO [Sporotomaculum syntrophicum]